MIIETDILIAALDSKDPHHDEAKSIITLTGSYSLSPYTLVELDLLIRSRVIEVKDYQLFWSKLNDMLNYYKITVVTPSPLYHGEADKLRARYNLTYFDSLHAATAIVGGEILVSYDEKAYRKIEKLNYIHPTLLLKKIK